MSERDWVHVELSGHGTFWVERHVLRGEDDGALAPEAHMTNGQLDFEKCFDSDAYAHVYPTGIMRFHQKIGVRTDLKPVGQIAVIEPPT